MSTYAEKSGANSMRVLAHVRLNGHNVVVRIGEAFADNPLVYYPLQLEYLGEYPNRDEGHSAFIGPAEDTRPEVVLDDYGFGEDLRTFLRDDCGKDIGELADVRAQRIVRTDCAEPGCEAWYDAGIAGILCDEGKPGRGPYYTGWQFPYDAEIMPDDRDEAAYPDGYEPGCNVHDHRTADGEGHAGTPPREMYEAKLSLHDEVAEGRGQPQEHSSPGIDWSDDEEPDEDEPTYDPDEDPDADVVAQEGPQEAAGRPQEPREHEAATRTYRKPQRPLGAMQPHGYSPRSDEDWACRYCGLDSRNPVHAGDDTL